MNSQTRRICWAFPQKCCFLGDCQLCKQSDYRVDFDRLYWMCNQLGYQIGQGVLQRTMEMFA